MVTSKAWLIPFVMLAIARTESLLRPEACLSGPWSEGISLSSKDGARWIGLVLLI